MIPQEKIIDLETGKIFFRDYNSEQLAALEQSQKEMQDISNRQIAKAKLRDNALAKLAALGLTEDEIAAL